MVKASIEKAMETSIKEHSKTDSSMVWAVKSSRMGMHTKDSMSMDYPKELASTTGMMAASTRATSSRAYEAGMDAGE